MHLSQTNFMHLSQKAAESVDDIYNTIAGDVDDKVDSKSVEESVAAKLRLAKWKADRLEKEEKMNVQFSLYFFFQYSFLMQYLSDIVLLEQLMLKKCLKKIK
jgi:hypothetical protein